jgi:hypothetical protein
MNAAPLTHFSYTGRCVFPYWVRLEDKESGRSVTDPRCLRLEPSWMSDRKSEIGKLLLTDLSMAETHDAAAYKSVPPGQGGRGAGGRGAGGQGGHSPCILPNEE